MFDKLKYKLKTKDYFDPQNSDFVNEEDLEKILLNQTRNPHKLKNPSSSTDYGYFIVSNVGLEKANSIKGKMFECDMVEDLFYKSQWFGQFTIESESSIVIPNRYDIHLNPKKKLIIAKEFTKNIWHTIGGFYQLDKNIDTVVLASDLNLNEMVNLVKKSYFGRDLSNTLSEIKY